MIHSMTGYGKGSAVKNNFSAEVEIKSVNSRFLEVFLKLPPLLSDREYEMREILKSKIKRGKINVIVQLKRNGNNDLAMVNETKLKGLDDAQWRHAGASPAGLLLPRNRDTGSYGYHMLDSIH